LISQDRFLARYQRTVDVTAVVVSCTACGIDDWMTYFQRGLQSQQRRQSQ
jgi:hypothetical protein